jgi:hypothetical protein
MVQPADAIIAIHNGFRNDLSQIDAAALKAARGKPGQESSIERYTFLNEVLVWHAKGEELAVFPAIEKVAPLVSEAYLKDHHGLDSAFMALDRAYSARDLLETARATAAFRFHLFMHLGKEDSHLYRIFRQQIPLTDQVKAMNVMAGSVPRERFADLAAWLFPLIGIQDRENMTLIWKQALPEPLFTKMKEVIHLSIGDEDWAGLASRIPDL